MTTETTANDDKSRSRKGMTRKPLTKVGRCAMFAGSGLKEV